jgi:hypothetical protein
VRRLLDRLGLWLERHAIEAVAILALVDVVTLAITLLIALNQGAAIDEAHAQGCKNAGAIIGQTQRNVALTNADLLRAFNPDLTDDQVNAIIDFTQTQAAITIRDLSEGCTADELGDAPRGSTVPGLNLP